jgi:hypothetical protein
VRAVRGGSNPIGELKDNFKKRANDRMRRDNFLTSSPPPLKTQKDHLASYTPLIKRKKKKEGD